MKRRFCLWIFRNLFKIPEGAEIKGFAHLVHILLCPLVYIKWKVKGYQAGTMSPKMIVYDDLIGETEMTPEQMEKVEIWYKKMEAVGFFDEGRVLSSIETPAVKQGKI